MPSATIFLDESGDLGWKLDAPYRKGGSSRHLTISALCVPSDKSKIPGRAVRSLYRQYKWSPSIEKKWADMSSEQREQFATIAAKMMERHEDISLISIVVKKKNVMEHIRKDGNKLYNYMIRLALLDYMTGFDVVTFIPDPRAIKVKSGNSLHDYLQTELWFTKISNTLLITRPMDSQLSKGVQFADMLAGVVQSKHEFNKTKPFQILNKHLTVKTLYF